MFTAMRRTMAMLLAAVMILTAVPLAAIAEEFFDNVVIAVQDTEEETLIEEIMEDSAETEKSEVIPFTRCTS